MFRRLCAILAVMSISLSMFLLSAAVAGQRGAKVVKKDTKQGATTEPGYYAIVIGNNNYKYMNKLKTAVNDARDVEKLLKDKYGFTTRLLLDATRTEILDTISEMREKISGKDSLLIYYAGHGIFDDKADKAYWLPVDAKRNSDSNWIIADDITANIRRVPSSHVLIVSDSCYSGKLTRAEVTDMRGKGERDGYLKKMQARSSRTLMASGGNEPVSDSGGGNNSVFASAFIRALREAETNVFTAEELFYGTGKLRGVKSIVAGKSEQLPEYAEIRNSGHDGGDFVFLAKGSVIAEEPKEPGPQEPAISESTTGAVTVKSNISKAKVYIDGKYQGETPVTKTLSAGNYEIEIRKDGYITGKETVRVERDKSKTVSILLDKSSGSIKVSSDPSGAKIYLDGAYTNTTPDTIADLKAGSYKIKVIKDGYREYTATVSVSEGQEAEVSANLEALKKASTRGASYIDPTTGTEFVFVKGGCYQMGDTFGDGDKDEKPVHEVCVDDFYIGKYDVTVGDFRRFVSDTGYSTEAEKSGECYYYVGNDWKNDDSSKNWKNPGFSQEDRNPVVCVSWSDATAYAEWMQSKNGKTVRLPTEAEWEYAARSGGKAEIYAGGNDIDSVAWYYGNSGNRSHAVGTKKPNGLGLYDMSGNVWQFTADWYGENYYNESQRNNPKGPGSGQYKALRGGSWGHAPRHARAAVRAGRTAAARHNMYSGFRLALSVR